MAKNATIRHISTENPVSVYMQAYIINYHRLSIPNFAVSAQTLSILNILLALR